MAGLRMRVRGGENLYRGGTELLRKMKGKNL